MVLKRICNEFEMNCIIDTNFNKTYKIQKEKFENLEDIQIIITGKEKEKIITFYYKKNNNEEGYIVEMTCPADYPFRPPKDVYINYEEYNGKIEMSRSEAKFINNKYDLLCTCCESIFCGNNWNPLYRIKYIIDERNFWDTLLDMYNKLKIIKRRKRNIPIEIWSIIEDYIFISKENYHNMRRTGKYII